MKVDRFFIPSSTTLLMCDSIAQVFKICATLGHDNSYYYYNEHTKQIWEAAYNEILDEIAKKINKKVSDFFERTDEVDCFLNTQLMEDGVIKQQRVFYNKCITKHDFVILQSGECTVFKTIEYLPQNAVGITNKYENVTHKNVKIEMPDLSKYFN